MTGYPPVNPANVVVLEERNIQGQKPVSCICWISILNHKKHKSLITKV